MAKQTVNLGVVPNGVGGDDVRTGFTKVNDNFTELYTPPTQVEAETGTSQVVKGWTAQRVRQAIVAWYTGISGAIGRTILGRSTAEQVRGDLGLGTAAQATLTTSSTDVTVGRVLKVGDGGWLGLAPVFSLDFDTRERVSGLWVNATASIPNKPLANNPGYSRTIASGGLYLYEEWFDRVSGRSFYRVLNNGTFSAWNEMYSTGNLLNIGTTPDSARLALDLRTAATKNVGTATGDVLVVGAFGVGNSRQTNWVDAGADISTGISTDLSATSGLTGLPSGFTQGRTSKFTFGHASYPSVLLAQRGNKLSFFSGASTDSVNYVEIYHTGNTTLDPDGTLKASSPVINLYTDKHDLHNESQFGATPTVTRKSKGEYEITGTLGLRSEGWYLDTPSDRNGNKYFNIEWAQNITPDAEDGVVDEYRDDIVVTIETFERVWNKDTGLFENGAPMDINDLQDRFVQLRFNEIKVEHEELDDETITRDQE